MAGIQESPSLDQMLRMVSKCCKCRKASRTIKGKLLPCGHVMCISCLQELEQTLRQQKEEDERTLSVPTSAEENEKTKTKPLSLSCPDCLKSFHAQDSGLSNLQSLNLDFSLLNQLLHMNLKCREDCKDVEETNAQQYCHECDGWMCNSCAPEHCKVKDNSSHHVVSVNEYYKTFNESADRCPMHGERATMFCAEKNCMIPVCMMCLSISHAGHKTLSFADAVDLITNQLAALRRANKRRQEALRDNKQKVTMKLADERRKYSETKEQIERRTEEIRLKLESMRSQATEIGEQSIETINGDFIVANLVDKLLKSAMQQDVSTNILLGVSRMVKSNRQWFPSMIDGPNGPEFLTVNSSSVALGVVDLANDILSQVTTDPCYKALLEPQNAQRSPSPTLLRTLNGSNEKKKYTMSNHFVPDEIASYLSKPGEELSQLSVKHTTTLSNNDLGLLVGFYSSAFGWENGVLVLSCRNANKTFKCKRAFSVKYQKHTYSKIAAFGSSHLLLSDDTNRCVVTYTLNGKEVSSFNFSPHEVPRHIEVTDNKLIVTFRHEIKCFMINIAGDLDGVHRVLFVLYNNIRGFDRENVVLEDTHEGENGQLFVRGFVYPEDTNRVREDPCFLNYRIYVLDDQVRCSGKVSYNSCTDMYGIGSIALSPEGRYLYASDYNQNTVLEVPIKRVKKRTTLEVRRSTCLLSGLDGVDKLKNAAVDKYGNLIVVQAKDVKIFKKA